jgi:hypothetical protein
LANFRYPTRIAPPRSIPPKIINPVEKDLTCPIIPIMAGIAPPPRRKLTGTVRETAMLLNLSSSIRESAAKPGGKKEEANIG